MQAIIFSIAGSLILGIYAHFSFQRHLVTPMGLRKEWTFAFDCFLAFAAFFRFIYRLQNDFTRNALVTAVIKLSFVLLGFTGLVIIFLIVLDVAMLIQRKTKAPASLGPERRKFLRQAVTFGGLASAGIATGTSYQSSYEPKLKEVTIPLKDAHKGLSGMKIVQLSDIHIGPNLDKEFAQQLVDRVNPLEPDLIVITGDMVDGSPDYLKDDLAPFKDFKAKLGVYFVTGNHEYYWGGQIWNEVARGLGMRPLVNQHEALAYNGTPFAIAGVTDMSSQRYDSGRAHSPDKALQDVPPELYKILLAHRPKTCRESALLGVNLQLSGHTHAGQGYPWRFIVMMVEEHYEGLYDYKGMQLYVNSGTGFWGPPNRLGVSGEISLLTLRHS